MNKQLKLTWFLNASKPDEVAGSILGDPKSINAVLEMLDATFGSDYDFDATDANNKYLTRKQIAALAELQDK